MGGMLYPILAFIVLLIGRDAVPVPGTVGVVLPLGSLAFYLLSGWMAGRFEARARRELAGTGKSLGVFPPHPRVPPVGRPDLRGGLGLLRRATVGDVPSSPSLWASRPSRCTPCCARWPR